MSLRRLPKPGYFSDAKPAFLELIDPRGLRILDLGCGGGHNGALLKRAGAREVVGVELNAGAAAQARKRLDIVVQGDLAHLDLEQLGDEPFDAILASTASGAARCSSTSLARMASNGSSPSCERS